MAKAKKRTDGLKESTFTYQGRRYHVYGRTYKELAEKIDQKKAEVKEKRYIKNCELTFDQYNVRWTEAREGTVKEATLRKNQFEFKAASKAVIDSLGTTFGSLKIVDIEVQNMRDLQKALINSKRESGLKLYNTNTINGIMAHVKHILNDAMKEQIIDFNPAISVKSLKRTEEEATETIHRALSVAETKEFFDIAQTSWYYDVYRFMLCSGCRIGEVGALKQTDIDCKNNVIHIQRTMTKTVLGNYMIGDSAKSRKGKRDIPLTDDLKVVIEHQKSIYRMLEGNILPFDGFIFKSPEGKMLNETSTNRDIARICKKANIEKFTSHAFRDTFATRAVESGMKPKTLQEILGHADIGMTMNLYAHVMDETKSREMREVSIGL